MSDYKKIKKEMNSLIASANSFKCVNYTKFPKIIENNSIGTYLSFIKHSNYKSRVSEIIDKNHCEIVLVDGSIIKFHYYFNKSDLVGHSLYYLPSLEYKYDYKKNKNELILKKEIDNSYEFDKEGIDFGHLDLNNKSILSEQENSIGYSISNALRIDYDVKNYKEFIHTKVHAHFGLYENFFRIPFENPISPKQFFFIVLKYIYHSDEEHLRAYLLNSIKFENKLSDDENKLLKVVFNR